MALLETTQMSLSKKENIRVAIRVRPLLPHEIHREEVIYYPTFEEGLLQVFMIFVIFSLDNKSS